jgi:hypothetical protein
MAFLDNLRSALSLQLRGSAVAMANAWAGFWAVITVYCPPEGSVEERTSNPAEIRIAGRAEEDAVFRKLSVPSGMRTVRKCLSNAGSEGSSSWYSATDRMTWTDEYDAGVRFAAEGSHDSVKYRMRRKCESHLHQAVCQTSGARRVEIFRVG